MMKKLLQNSLTLVLLVATLIMGCSPANNGEPSPAATITQENTVISTEMPTATVIPSPTPTPLPLGGQQTQYEIDVSINYYNRFVAATSRSVYTNKTNSPINEMLFTIYPTLFNAFFLRSVKSEDGKTLTNYYWDSHNLVIPLESPLMPGDQIIFTHDFELYMPDRGGVFSQTGRQLNLSYWFPFIPPYDETDGWIAHNPQFVNSSFIGEFLVFEAADFDVKLQFTDRRENFKIAAGAIPEEKDGVIHYQLELARTFVLSISDAFVMAERDFNGMKVQSFAFTEHQSIAEEVADIAVDSLILYTEYYGDLNRELVTVVEFNADIGMEFDGIIFLSPAFYNLYPGNPKSNIHVYTAHEIAHQWFFSLVGNDQAMEPWLDETLATYSELLFYERYYPELVSWWWDNYIDFHNPSGYLDISIYFGGGLHEYRNIVYRNGARFLQDLRDTIGDEAFFNFLKAYVNAHRYEIATSEGFWMVLNETTDADLSHLVEEYFSEPPNFP